MLNILQNMIRSQTYPIVIYLLRNYAKRYQTQMTGQKRMRSYLSIGYVLLNCCYTVYEYSC